MVAMNALLLPSTYEGLGIAIEALRQDCLLMRRQVYLQRHILRSLSVICRYQMARKMGKIHSEDLPKHKRRDTHQEIIDHGYDIVTAAKWLEDFYCSKRK